MPRKLSSFLIFAILLFSTVLVSSSIAVEKNEPHFSDVILTTSETNLLLFGTLNNGFTDEMIQGLHSGLPIQFSFFVELTKTRKHWTDERIVSMEFKHTLTYDTLKESYKVTMEETNQKTFTFQTLAEAKKAMNEINGLKVYQLSKLIPDQAYTLRVKAELYKKTLPMGLHHIVPFLSWWDIETDWYSIDFNY
jgi:Domain of unknown function (DUF4390)